MKACVVIGDIRSSRQISALKRAQIQRKMEQLLTQVNRKYKNQTCSPLKLTLGDEFQAVFKHPQEAWQAIQNIDLSAKKFQVKIRYALVEDELYTPINKREPLKMDGPAFWKARELIGQKRAKYAMYIAGNRYNSTINVLVSVIEDLEKSWERLNIQYIHYALAHPDVTITTMSTYYKKNPSTISRSLRSARLELYQMVKQELKRFLESK